MSNNETNARYSAYVVTDSKEPNGDAFWNRVATAYPHKKGDGFDLVIPPGLSLSGRIVIRKDKDKDPSQSNDEYRDQ